MCQKSNSKLYLIPNCLSENCFHYALPQKVIQTIHGLNYFIVENIRSARRFLSKINHPQRIDNLIFRELNEHTTETEVINLLQFIQTNNVGVITEAGVPGVADPGASIVELAHHNNIRVIPLVGPSSILMALMASGLNGQSFAFVGYLPVKKNERQEKIRFLEQRSIKEKQTQIFIETPYRNKQLLDDILMCCSSSTKLTIAAAITGNNEYIRTKSIKEWKTKLPELHKIPTVFLLSL